MQKRAYLFIFVGLALFVAISLVAVTTSGILFPVQVESKVAIVFNDTINKDNFVEATEGAQKILNTIVNVADFDEVKDEVFNSGFEVSENIFNGTSKENTLIWRRHVTVKPVDNAFVLKITITGRDQKEAEELAAVIAHEVSLEIPKLFTNLRGISDQPRLVNHQLEIMFTCFFVAMVAIVCFFIVLNFFSKNKKGNFSMNIDSNKAIVLTDKKSEGDPRYFLQKFLEEHQKK